MIPPCLRCSKDDFKKTRDRKAYLKRKFKCKPKPILQIKDQVVVQDPETGPGPATQTYREEQTIIQSNINQKKIHFKKPFSINLLSRRQNYRKRATHKKHRIFRKKT